MKTDTLNLRISPVTKSALRLIAEREKRSMSNMIDFLVTDYCDKNILVTPVKKQGLDNANKRNTSDDSPSIPKTGGTGTNDT